MLSAPAAIPATMPWTFRGAFTRPGPRSRPARPPGRQAAPLGQPHHRDQPGPRHEIRVIKRGVCPGGIMRQCRVAPARFRARAPSEPRVPVDPAHGSSKPRGRLRLKLMFRFPALAGLEPALAGRVHEADVVIVRRAGPPVMGQVAGCYCPAGDVQPPLFPLFGRLGWLLGGQQVVPAERATSGLPGQQAQGVPVQRGLDLASAARPSSSARAGSSGDAAPLTGTCRTIASRRTWPGRRRCRGHRTPTGRSWTC